MYILIDRENLVFVHKHPDHTVVSMLATIEVSHVATCILPIEEKAFSKLTDLELRLLHKHTTGKKLEGIFLPKLIKELVEVALLLPESDVSPFEVKQQAQKISFKDSGFYKYVKGAYTAAKLQDLFKPEPLTTDSPVVAKPIAVTLVAVPRAPAVCAAVAFKPVQPLPKWHPLYKSA